MMENSDCEPDEVIIISSSNSVTVYDSSGNNAIKAYKMSKLAPKCLSLMADEYFIGASQNIPEIKTWPVSEEQSLMSSPCGSVNALAVTSCGTYCVAAVKSDIRVWNVQSGEMLVSLSAHYQEVTCLKFTSEDSMFISGGKDGNVLVWVFSRFISYNMYCEQIKPLYTWTNHSKEVTDIFVGDLGIYSRIATSSTDMTVKIYELDTGLLLTTVCMDLPLASVVMDCLEYYLIVGTLKGSIFKINLYYEQPRELHSNSMEKEEVEAHSEAVSCLSISITGEKLLSCTKLGDLKLWEVASMSCIASIVSKEDSITNAFFTVRPSSLLSKRKPSFILKQLQRTVPGRTKIPYPRPLKLNGGEPLSLLQDPALSDDYSVSVLSGGREYPQLPSADDQQAAENLYQEAFRGETLNEVRDINAQMYTYMIEHAFKSMGEAPLKNEVNIVEMEY